MKKELICWDTSVMISFIKETEQERMGEINSVVQNIRNGHYALAVSTVIYPEVLESTMPPNAIKTFDKFMQNRADIAVVAVDIRVAQKAQEIRNKINLKTPDAIHIATAIINKATALHTYDDKMLKFNEKPQVDGLVITKCYITGQTRSLI